MERATVLITLDADLPNDGDLLAPFVAGALSEYLAMLNSGRAGNYDQESFVCSNGVKVSVEAFSSPAVDIPLAGPQRSQRLACGSGGQ